ncbi:fibronectin type III domain-containing protein [Emticicia oligotrophica]|uniref:fibronectin type III domain-containing protein n=1 Tax=Emticicia oligotrophica TaxID=312279 RepID=UPI0030EB2CA6
MVTFSYGKPCVAPEGMVINPIGKGRVQITCEATAEDAETYPITAWYKQEGTTVWNSLPLNNNNAVISGLKDKTEYEFKLSSACGDNTNTMTALSAGDLLPSGDASTDPVTFKIDDSEFDEEVEELDPAILDPYTIGVTLNADGTTRPVETLEGIFNKIIKPKCVTDADAYAECSPEHPKPRAITGTIELDALAIGDVLGIYDYAVLVTATNGSSPFSGKGLVRLPFLENTFMAVEFAGIKAKKGEAGTQGGCVYEVGDYFRTRPISQADLQNEQVRTIADIIKLTEPIVFHGDLEVAIKKYQEKGDEIAIKGTATPQEKQDLLTYTKGVEVAIGTWKEKFSEVFGSGKTDPKIAEILGDMTAILTQLNADKQTIEFGTSYPTIPALKAKVDVIIEKIKALQQENTPKPPKIQNVLATNIGYNDATLTWQGDPRFTKYVISYKTADGGELIETVTGNRLHLKNLLQKSKYGFTIEGYVGDKMVDKYGIGLFDTQKSSNPTPTNVRYSLQSDGTVLLEWDYPKEYGYTIDVTIKDKNGNEKHYFVRSNDTKVNIGKLISGDIYSYSIYVPKYDTSVNGIIDIKCGRFILTSSSNTIELGQSVTLTASGCPNDDVEWSDTPYINLRGKKYTAKPSGERTYTAYCKTLDCSKSVTISVTSTDCSDISFKINDPIYEYGSFWQANFTVSGCEGGNVYWDACEKCTPTYDYQNNNFEINGLGTTPITFYAKCVKNVNGVIKTCYDNYLLKSSKDCIFENLEITSTSKKIIKGTSLPLTIVGCSNGTIKWEHSGQSNRQLVVSPSEKTNYAVTCTPNESKCNTVRAVIKIDVIELDCNKFVISPFNEIFENTDPVTLKASECLGTLTWSNGSTGTSISVIPTTEAQKYSITCKIDETRQCSASSTVTFVPPNCNNFKVSSKQDSYNNVALSAIGCSGEVKWDKGLGNGATIEIKSLDATTTYTATCSTTKCAKAITVFIAPKAVQCPTFTISPYSVTADKYSNVTFTANNCTGTIKWDTGETTNTITVKAQTEKTYKATCEADGFTNIQCAVVKPSFILKPCTNDFKLSASDYYYTESDTKPITLSTSGNCSGTVSFSSGSNLVRPSSNSTYYAICDDGTNYCTSNAVAINVLTCNNIVNREGNFYYEIKDNFDKTKKIVTVHNCVGQVIWGGRLQSSYTFEVNIPAELTTYSLSCTRPQCSKSITLEGFCEDFTATIVDPSSVSAIGSSEKKTIFYNRLNQSRTIFTVGCPVENLTWKDMDGNIIYDGSIISDKDYIRAFCRINNSDCVRTINLMSPPSSANARTITQQTTATPIVDNSITYAAIIADESAAAECTTCNSCNIALNKGMSIFLKPLISDIITQTAVGKDANGNYTTASVKEFLEQLIKTLKTNPKLNTLVFPTDLTTLAQGFVNDKSIENLVQQLTISITGNVCTSEFNFNILPTYSTVANTLLPLAIPPLTLTATTTNASCDLNNGSVKLSATGGTPPYQYSKDGTTFQSSDTFEALVVGKYTFYVKDAKEEKGNTSVTIEEKAFEAPPQEIELTIIPLGNARTNNSANELLTNSRANITVNGLYIAPDGRAVRLPAGAVPIQLRFTGTWGLPPAGTLQGFKWNGSIYFAEIRGYINQSFVGYRKVPLCPEVYLKDIYETTSGETDAFYFKKFKDANGCGIQKISVKYTFNPTGDQSLIKISPDIAGDIAEKAYYTDQNACNPTNYVNKDGFKNNNTSLSADKAENLNKLTNTLNSKLGELLKVTLVAVNSADIEKMKIEAQEKGLQTLEVFEFEGVYLFAFGGGEIGTCEKDYITRKMKDVQSSDSFKTLGKWDKIIASTSTYYYNWFFAILKCRVAKEKYYTCTKDATNKETCTLKAGASEAEAFVAGFVHSVIEDLDFVEMASGIITMAKAATTSIATEYLNYPKELYEVYQKAPSTWSGEDIYKIIPPVKPTKESVEFVSNAISFFYSYYITDANYWTSGELTAMVAPAVITGGLYLAKKLPQITSKLAGRLASKVAGLGENLNIVALFKAGKKIDYDDIGDIEQIVVKQADEQIENIYEKVDDKLVKICGSCLAQNTAVFGTNATLENLQPLATVQTLEKDGSIGTRNVWGKTSKKVAEITKIWFNGEVIKSTTEHEFIGKTGKVMASAIRKGTLLFSLALQSFVPVDSAFIVKEPTIVEGLMLDGVEAYGVGAMGIATAPSNGWCVKGLDLVGHMKFNDWVIKNKTTLKYGTKVGDDAAEAIADALTKKLDDLGVNKTKTIIETLEDSQGRMTFVIKTDGVTHDLVTIQKNIRGEHSIDTYSRAYNPNANTNIDVGVSSNRLVPDYTKDMAGNPSNRYLYPQNLLPQGKSPVVRIKMSGKRRGTDGDFHRANIEAGLTGLDAPTDYVWHHFDDFEVDVNGDVWCTMQLVRSDVHTGISGMAHSGSVAQWKSYFIDSSNAPNNLWYNQ